MIVPYIFDSSANIRALFQWAAAVQFELGEMNIGEMSQSMCPRESLIFVPSISDGHIFTEHVKSPHGLTDLTLG